MIVKAVIAQNEKGPIAGLDNPKWKTLRRSDVVVKEFQSNPAGQYLKQRIGDSNGTYAEAFLSASQGEKVAFFECPIYGDCAATATVIPGFKR